MPPRCGRPRRAAEPSTADPSLRRDAAEAAAAPEAESTSRRGPEPPSPKRRRPPEVRAGPADRRPVHRRRASRRRRPLRVHRARARASSACSKGSGDAGIRVVATRHEGGAAFMAEAHGQLTGRPAVALGTRAVGAANLAIGIHTARQDSAPMFVARRPGRARRSAAARRSRRSTRPRRSAGSRPTPSSSTSLAELPQAVGDAVRAALGGRPGPAYLSVSKTLN